MLVVGCSSLPLNVQIVGVFLESGHAGAERKMQRLARSRPRVSAEYVEEFAYDLLVAQDDR